MDLTLLKTFVKVASIGSISKAAVLLCVTQSAVSRRIKLLEEHYGHPLLERTGTSLKPTPAGKMLIEKAMSILDIERQILDSLGVKESKQKISFCCTPSFGISSLPTILNSFLAGKGEEADLKFVFAMPEEALDGIRSGRFDLALIEHCDDLDLNGYRTHPLPADEMVFISAPARGIDTPEPDIDRLLGERLYLKNETGCAKRFLNWNMRSIGRDGNEFVNTVYFDDCPFILSQVRAGNGIAFVSASIVQAELHTGTLRAHRIAGFNPLRPRTLVFSPHMECSPAIHAFIETLFAAHGIPCPASLPPRQPSR
ncbi:MULTISPECIES: LysR family transcriptional regulator [Geobacter]|uniref:LysR family transcriptional regulator n=2 Tax=Geobacter TaxID=28231 RepID=A0A0C1TV74_9BACT|nr:MULTISPECIES: LysR family transcriptional regulator [Geobacter]ANA41164.1 LysR family transcriptional regulator [Geobacter anodireducens]KIE43298.1 LysR family transcriptional regulator [Geobacter soli]MBE2887679.1 LysR family transcriptional regulator [Geobacter anodireducens]